MALKMALQFNVNRKDERKTVLALTHSYHGDTFKTMEVGDDEDYHFAFGEKKGVIHIPTEIPALEEAFEKHHGALNCFIVEPLLQGAGGMLMYDPAFLKRARQLCDKHDVLLIFDEVITGFRLCYGGACDLFHIKPDLVTLGKIVGGGMPLAAYGGAEEIMRVLAPEGEVYQAGTLSGNPVAVTAGIQTLTELGNHPEIYDRIDQSAQRLEKAFRKKDCR